MIANRAGVAAARRAGFSAALGLVVLSTLGCAIGLIGRLETAWLLGIVTAVLLAGEASRRSLGVRSPLTAHPEARSTRLLLGACGLALLAPLFALALYPPTAFDETLYHLPMARAFARSGTLPFLADLRFPVFPHLGEVLFAEMMLLGGDAATHLVQLLAVILVALLLVAWGGDAESHAAGWLAAAVWLGNPLVVYLATTAYVEPLLALFATSACYALWIWLRENHRFWLTLSAVCAGAAASTKYLGLFFVVALGVVIALRRSAGRSRAPAVVWFAAIALATMAPWYGRILWFTGNPLFPYFSEIFGANDWMPVNFRASALPPAHDALSAILRGVGRVLTLPWDAVVRRDRTGGLPPLSPAYLAGAPLLALAAIRGGALRRPLLLAVVFSFTLMALPPDARYLVAVLPLFSVCLGAALAEQLSRRSLGRSAAIALALVLVSPGWLYASYRLVRQGLPPITPAARDAYLRRALPLYPALRFADDHLAPGATVYALHAENMHDFMRRGRFVGDWYGPQRFAALEAQVAARGDLRSALLEWGVDGLLVPKRLPGSTWTEAAEHAGLTRLFEDDAAVLYGTGEPAKGP